MPSRRKTSRPSQHNVDPPPRSNKKRTHNDRRKSSQDDDANQPFLLFEGETDALEFWQNDLADADKVACLQIEPEELSEVVTSLDLLAFDPSSTQAGISSRLIDAFLSNADVMSALRLAFVNALYNEGMFDPTQVRAAARTQGMLNVHGELLIQCALSVLESHLIEVQRRKRAVVRIIAFALFFIFRIAAFSRWFRWPLGVVTMIALHIASAQTGAAKDELDEDESDEYVALQAQYKALIRRYQSHLQLLLVPFEPVSPAVRYIAFDRSGSPINAKIDALCTAICTSTLIAEHYTMDSLGTWICLVLLATLPFILTTIQQHGRRQSDPTMVQQALYFTQVAVAAVSQLIVVYYAFKSSYFDWIFTMVFFLPNLTSFIVSGIGLGLATFATILSGAQRLVLDYSKHPIVYCVIWICLMCNHFFMGNVDNSWLLWIFSWLCIFLLAPPQISGGLSVIAATSVETLLSVGLTHVLGLIFELVLLGSFSALVLAFHFSRSFLQKAGVYVLRKWLTRGWCGSMLRKLVDKLRYVRAALYHLRAARSQADET